VDIPRDPRPVRWRVHLAAARETVFPFLSTDEGRARFWAETANESEGVIEYHFVNGMVLRSRVLESRPPSRFAVTYFGSSVATFDLEDDGRGGTDLTLTETGVPSGSWEDNHAGWVSVLLALKAAVEFSGDLRNHDQRRTWDEGYADN